MAVVFQGIGAATALSSTNAFDSKRLLFSSRISLLERKSSFFVVRSDGRLKFGSNPRDRKADQLITNAVAVISLSLSLSLVYCIDKHSLYRCLMELNFDFV
ncbi:hypothetical protein CsSME_00031315 [Camellia sinensis var. sinensis]